MISSGFAYGNFYELYNPSLYTPQKFLINDGSIYSALKKENSFSQYLNLIEKSELYKNLFNDSLPKTFFVVPDKYISLPIKNKLSKLPRDEATSFLDYHTIDDAVDQSFLRVQTRRQGFLIHQDNINILSSKTFFNGIVYVIDNPVINLYSFE